LALVQKLEMKHQPVHAGHSLMLQNDRERTLVKQFLARFRALPAQQQATHSELLNDLGKLQVAAGDFAGASKTFLDVADVAPSDRAKAEAHHNAYHAALEQADFQLASTEWSRAIALDPARFAPFPLDKYEALRILGAGGFGVTFLCRHKISKGQVAVKALFADELARDIQTVMEEATTLDHLKHRAIVGLRDCGFADVAQTRPYLVMAYFNGMTLEEHVKTKGTLPIEDVLPIAETMAEALEAAHGARVLHRDIKPANVLIRKDGDTWEICLIDFGLAVKQGRLDSATGSFNQGKSLLRESAVGTLGYAAPEQLGRIPGAVVGPRADIYGFGKTLAYALFGMAEPGLQHYRKLPEKFAELLSDCINQAPEERPANFAEVRKRLRKEKAKSPKTTAIMDVVAVDLEEEPDQRPIRKKRREDAEPRQTVDIDLGTRILHGALAFFLGWTGIHKFMQDNTGAGITRLALSCTGVGLYLTLPAGIIEAVMYLARGNEDYHERYIRKKQWWF
jgi:serine/threonine protein kinase